MYGHYLSNFGRPPIPDDLSKSQPQGIFCSGEEDF